jgi:pilus assembly protein Flp/PilA
MSKLFVRLQLVFYRAFDDESGQSLTEYALILALVAVVAMVALSFLGGRVRTALTTVATSL